MLPYGLSHSELYIIVKKYRKAKFRIIKEGKYMYVFHS